MTSSTPTMAFRLAAMLLSSGLAAAQTLNCQAQDSPSPDHRLAFFARMMDGEWKMTADSGASVFRTWHWGPGQHSLRVMNDGKDAAGNPWLDFDVVYWHPGSQEIRVFGVSQFYRGITEGVASVDGERAVVDFDLHQTGGRRRLRSEVEYLGPDRHHVKLSEAKWNPDLSWAPLAEWDVVRNQSSEGVRRIDAGDSKAPSELIRPLQSLLGHWDTWTNSASESVRHLRSSIEWIPRADALYVRVTEPREEGGSTHLLDAYLYHHTGTGRLRCLAFSKDGGVYEGDLTVQGDGSFQFDLDGAESDRSAPFTVTITFDSKHAARLRVWAKENDKRKLVLDNQAGLRGTLSCPPGLTGRGPGQPEPPPATGETVLDPGQNVPYVFQARNGDYWFGTREGAFRYDGKSLVKFTMRDGLCRNQISGFQEDKAGKLYISTGEGVSRFDGKSFTTLPIASGGDLSDWKLNPDDLWFVGPGDSGLVYRFDGESLHPLAFPTMPRGDEHAAQCPRWRFPNAIYSPYDVYSILKDSHGHVWFGTTSCGVGRFDGQSFQWLTEPLLVAAPVRAIFEDSRGNYWISGSGAGSVGAARPIEGFDQLQTGGQGKLIDGMSFVEDNDGKIWAANYKGGATRYEESGALEFPIRAGEEIVEVFTVFRDNNGTIWLGTHNGGAWLFNGKEFQRFRTVW
jgi:Two component regulator propeller